MKTTFSKNTLPKSLPLLFKKIVYENSNNYIQGVKIKNGTYVYKTYETVYKDVLSLALSFESLGIKPNSHVGLIADNRQEWLITDLAILSLGACDIPRGCDTMGQEIEFILTFAECETCIFESEKQFQKIAKNLNNIPLLKTIVFFESCSESIKKLAESANLKVFIFADLLSKGQNILSKGGFALQNCLEKRMEEISKDDIATIIFTSGTTGVPKGVMLTHENFMVQLEVIHNFVNIKPNERWMNVLPVWHSYERIFQYIAIVTASCLSYSKPFASLLISDMKTVNPSWMCGVPRLWSAIAQNITKDVRRKGGLYYSVCSIFFHIGKQYQKAKSLVFGLQCRTKKTSRFLEALIAIIPFIILLPFNALGNVLFFKKIREKLGCNLKIAVSAGGSLPKDINTFYNVIGIKMLEAYGMTETAPLLTMRRAAKPRAGCVGEILPCVEVKIVKEKNGKIISSNPLSPSKRGIICVRGKQIMKGYYKRPDLTAEIIDKDGWLSTGDLGLLTFDNEIKITGRAKDTIVLLGGENVEPNIIEQAISQSKYIDSIVIFGQDQKALGALIVPNHEMLESFATENSVFFTFYEELLEDSEIKDLIRHEIDNYCSAENGFRICERISSFILLENSFKVGEELSAKQELMRYRIAEKYSKEIKMLF